MAGKATQAAPFRSGFQVTQVKETTVAAQPRAIGHRTGRSLPKQRHDVPLFIFNRTLPVNPRNKAAAPRRTMRRLVPFAPAPVAHSRATAPATSKTATPSSSWLSWPKARSFKMAKQHRIKDASQQAKGAPTIRRANPSMPPQESSSLIAWSFTSPRLTIRPQRCKRKLEKYFRLSRSPNIPAVTARPRARRCSCRPCRRRSPARGRRRRR